jgi:beta-N-acetylhexosaminidase
VLGCGKHFPGLGESNLDTHLALPSVSKSLARMWAQDLVPYRTMRRELPMVMVSHADFPAITSAGTGARKIPVPASLSTKWITGILQKKIGYRGLICSDDLEMGGVLAAAPVEQAFIGHIRAGGDLGLICHKEELILRAHAAVMREMERDKRFAKRVRESAQKVLAFKKKVMAKRSKVARPAPSPTPQRVDKLKSALWEFGEEIRLTAIARTGRA